MIRYIIAIHGAADGALQESNTFTEIRETWSTTLDSPSVCIWVSDTTNALHATRHAVDNAERHIIGRSFLSHAAECEGDLATTAWGAFISVTLNMERRSIRIYRDPTGRLECWRAHLGEYDIFFSHLEDVATLLPRSLTVNWDYIAFHLANRWLHNEQTGYNEVTELLPGDEITFSPAGSSVVRRWHPSQFIAQPYATPEEARQGIRSAAEMAVEGWASLYRAILIDLSGGLDSAIVLGLLRGHLRHSDVVGVNYVIRHAEGDERQFATEAGEMNGISVLERDPSDGLEVTPPSFTYRLLRPSIRTMPLGYDAVATTIQRESDRDAFFSGTGGDHVFYDHISTSACIDHFRRKGMHGLVGEMHQLAQVSRSTIWAALSSFRADRRASYRSPVDALFAKCGRYFAPNPFVALDVSTGTAFERFLHPVVLELAESLSPSRLYQILNFIELQKHYWRYGRADDTDEVHPLLSQPLFEASLRTPCNWFCDGGVQRGLARSAFADLLPQSILQRRFKSANSSHWVNVLSHNLPKFRALMLDGELASRGFLRKDRVEAMASPLGIVESADFGAFVNTLSVASWIDQSRVLTAA